MDLDFSAVSLGGIALIPVLIGWVQMLKRLKIVTGETALTAVLLSSVGAGLLYQAVARFPGIESWVNAAVFSLAFGLAAAKIYDEWVDKTP